MTQDAQKSPHKCPCGECQEDKDWAEANLKEALDRIKALEAENEALRKDNNSKAQERHRAKDKVVEKARKLDQYKIASFIESGYSTKEWDELQDALLALDSIQSEAKACKTCKGQGFVTEGEYPDYQKIKCPFCDKKTGGV